MFLGKSASESANKKGDGCSSLLCLKAHPSAHFLHSRKHEENLEVIAETRWQINESFMNIHNYDGNLSPLPPKIIAILEVRPHHVLKISKVQISTKRFPVPSMDTKVGRMTKIGKE